MVSWVFTVHQTERPQNEFQEILFKLFGIPLCLMVLKIRSWIRLHILNTLTRRKTIKICDSLYTGNCAVNGKIANKNMMHLVVSFILFR